MSRHQKPVEACFCSSYRASYLAVQQPRGLKKRFYKFIVFRIGKLRKRDASTKERHKRDALVPGGLNSNIYLVQ